MDHVAWCKALHEEAAYLSTSLPLKTKKKKKLIIRRRWLVVMVVGNGSGQCKSSYLVCDDDDGQRLEGSSSNSAFIFQYPPVFGWSDVVIYSRAASERASLCPAADRHRRPRTHTLSLSHSLTPLLRTDRSALAWSAHIREFLHLSSIIFVPNLPSERLPGHTLSRIMSYDLRQLFFFFFFFFCPFSLSPPLPVLLYIS